MRSHEKLMKQKLDELYKEYNNKKYIKYDPIEYVYRFECVVEKELVGLISSSISFGRVTQIFRAMDHFLEIVNNEPLEYVLNLRKKPDRELLSFKYRFVNGPDMFNFLQSIKKIIEEHGSLGEFAKKKYRRGCFLGLVDKTIKQFKNVNYLIPSTLNGSPCKRLLMFFRWMVRNDQVDLGIWDFINTQELVIPLDTHISRVSKELGFTSKKTSSLKTAIEITNNLKKFSENDPVKYDWALSHIGIIKNNFGIEELSLTEHTEALRVLYV